MVSLLLLFQSSSLDLLVSIKYCFFLVSWVSLRNLLMSSILLLMLSSISLKEFSFPHHPHKVTLEIIFFCIFWVRMIKSSCCTTTEFWRYHVAFYVVGWILALPPTHLFLQLVLAVSLPLGPILKVVVCVFETCSWPTLCFRESCQWGLSLYCLLSCSFGLQSWVTLLVHSVQSQLVEIAVAGLHPQHPGRLLAYAWNNDTQTVFI